MIGKVFGIHDAVYSWALKDHPFFPAAILPTGLGLCTLPALAFVDCNIGPCDTALAFVPKLRYNDRIDTLALNSPTGEVNMPTVSTKSLKGKQLDWAVGYLCCLKAVDGNPVLARDLMNVALKNGMASPSTDACRGIALIQEYRIALVEEGGAWFAAMSDDLAAYRRDHEGNEAKFMVYDKNVVMGETPLIAASRCFVYRRAGKTIDVPNFGDANTAVMVG